MSLGKLVRKERSIFVYKKTNSKFPGKEVQQVSVDHIPLETLKNIITPNADDPFLLDGYPLKPEELDKLNALTGHQVNPDHNKFDYVLECYWYLRKVRSDIKTGRRRDKPISIS